MLRFGLVGALGFVIDAAVLHLLVQRVGLSPFLARVPSFLSAVAVTWAANRHYTFAQRRSPRRGAGQEALRYTAVQSVGACINYAVYAAALLLQPAWQATPVLALAVGSAVAMVFNYLAARHVVFVAAPPAPER